MSTLSDIVNISITTLSSQIKQAGFGVPLIVDGHTRFPERVRFYNSLTALTDDGFLTTDAAYKCATKLLSQNPQVSVFAVGRRANLPTMEVRITPTAANLHIYKVKLNGTEVSYTADGSATVAEITAGLTALLSALAVSGVTVSDQTTYVRVLGTAPGNWFYVEASEMAFLKVEQAHADPGIAADMDAILLETDAWYGLTLTTSSKAELVALAAWTEAQKKIGVYSTQDSECATVVDGSATDIAHTLKGSTYFRSAVFFSYVAADFIGAAMLGRGLPKDPGSLTFKFKTLGGVTANKLTATHTTNLKAKNCNFYTTFGGQPMTAEGTMASGEFIDVIRDRDWFEARLQTRIAGVLVNLDKLPFTDAGIAVVEAELRAQISEGISAGFLSPDVRPVIIVPRAASINPTDKAARKLTGITFTATLAGAVHMVTISGTISV